MTWDTVAVRLLSIAIVGLLVGQYVNRAGGAWHIRCGISAALVNALLLIATLYRGYVQYDLPHGALYPVHLVLGILFFIVCGIACFTGYCLTSDTFEDHTQASYVVLHSVHRWSARGAVVLCIASLVVGIISFLRL